MAGTNTKPSPFAMMKLWPITRSHCRKLFSVLCLFNRKKHVDDTDPKTAGDGAIAGSDTAVPELMDDLLAEIFLRLHLEDGRASLVCKRWHRIISDPYFRSRYRKFHSKRLKHLYYRTLLDMTVN
ncbi:hypothetical protein ACP70R_014591 [Stipagrostis hirtigluma subsp. patula]